MNKYNKILNLAYLLILHDNPYKEIVNHIDNRKKRNVKNNDILYPSKVVNIPSVNGKAFLAPISVFSIFLIDSLLLLSDVVLNPIHLKLDRLNLISIFWYSNFNPSNTIN